MYETSNGFDLHQWMQMVDFVLASKNGTYRVEDLIRDAERVLDRTDMVKLRLYVRSAL